MPSIAMVSYKYPPLYSGYGNQAAAVIEEIGQSDPDLDFLILTWNHGVENIDLPNTTVYKMGRLNNRAGDYIKTVFFGFFVFAWLLLNRNKYDLIHCLSSFSHAVFAITAGRILGKKVIIKITQSEMRKTDSFNFLKNLLRKLRQNYMRYGDYFIVLNDLTYRELLNWGIDSYRIVTIPNGVNNRVFKPVKSDQEKQYLRKKLRLPASARVLLFSGSLNERKGIKDLIAALEKRSFFVPAFLVICGPDYGYGQELVLKKEQINMVGNIELRYDGLVDNIQDYYAAADIFVLPSYAEGLSNALLEAAMSGLALIGSDIGGNREVIIDGLNGYLFPAGDVNYLASLISELVHVQYKAEKMGREAASLARLHSFPTRRSSDLDRKSVV